MATGWVKLIDGDADGYALLTVFTVRAIGKFSAASKALADEFAIHGFVD